LADTEKIGFECQVPTLKTREIVRRPATRRVYISGVRMRRGQAPSVKSSHRICLRAADDSSMGAVDPGETDGASKADPREPRDDAVAADRAAHSPEAASPPPSYRIGGGNAHLQPATRPSRVPTLIVLGLLLACAMALGIVQWRTHVALATATSAANREAERAAEEASREEQAAIEREAMRRQQLQSQDEARRRELDERRQAEEIALNESRAQERARQRAWAEFYRPAPGCKDATTVECANAFIRARQAFDKRYAADGVGAASAPGP